LDLFLEIDTSSSGARWSLLTVEKESREAAKAPSEEKQILRQFSLLAASRLGGSPSVEAFFSSLLVS
jgi:hypothetical protein